MCPNGSLATQRSAQVRGSPAPCTLRCISRPFIGVVFFPASECWRTMAWCRVLLSPIVPRPCVRHNPSLPFKRRHGAFLMAHPFCFSEGTAVSRCDSEGWPDRRSNLTFIQTRFYLTFHVCFARCYSFGKVRFAKTQASAWPA